MDNLQTKLNFWIKKGKQISMRNIQKLESSTNTNAPPLPDAGVLLLSGDNYCISPEGVSRTLYRINPGQNEFMTKNMFAIEEEFDLSIARKKFIIRKEERQEGGIKKGSCITLKSRNNGDDDESARFSNTIDVGARIHTIQVQEIKSGIERAGTGACTWETSILSSLYFASRCAEVDQTLKGRVLELGSGIGLGALLTRALIDGEGIAIGSITLSDYIDEVIGQCRENILNNSANSSINMNVHHINWYDHVQNSMNADKFDTIIASDIVYRRQDIAPLVSTISSHLNETSGIAHLFGPNNRAMLHDFVEEVRNSRWNMDVTTEVISMDRFRLEPQENPQECFNGLETVASQQSSHFLHVTVRHRDKVSEHGCFSDLD
jgi:predicted nicotinamide N-methyase